MSERMLVVWCDDWSAAACGLPSAKPAIVVHDDVVISATPGARRAGVQMGQWRRMAEMQCPELTVIEHEMVRDEQRFKPILDAIKTVASRIEMLHPGACAIPIRGSSRYFGSDRALARHVGLLVREALRDQCIETRCSVGIADGVFAATLAAKQGVIVEPGESSIFLEMQSPVVSIMDTALVSAAKAASVLSGVASSREGYD